MTRVVAVLTFALIAVGCLASNAPPTPPRRTNMALTITQATIPNGLRVVLVRDPRASEVQVTMRYDVGGADDGEHPGMAHLVEHLMFQQVLGSQTLFAHLQEAATWFNAFTTWDATTYAARASADRLDRLLSIEAVRLGFRCGSITESAFTREREVVVNEIRQRAVDAEVIEGIHRALYPVGHPYHQRISGDVTSVGAITMQQACGFADAHYAPDNAVLVVSGDLTPAQLSAALGKFLGKVAKRHGVAAVRRPALATDPQHVTARVPIDDDALVLAWPLPEDPKLRTVMRALLPAVQGAINGDIEGTIAPIELGDARNPMIGFYLSPDDDESTGSVLTAARKAIEQVPVQLQTRGFVDLDKLVFDSIRQTAIYEQYSSLEGGSDRDARLASWVLAGIDPNQAIAAEFASLRDLDRESAARIVETLLAFDRAHVVTLAPADARKRGVDRTPRPAIHDRGQQRDVADPAEAHHVVSNGSVPGAFASMRVRTLANGLKIVLLPLTSVPIVDIRLVFRSGTADELPTKTGVAVVAAHGLDWDLRYLNDWLAFVAAGGNNLVDVDTDHTAFVARGVDMHVDYLLTGLRRWIRDGTYRGREAGYVAAVRNEAKNQRRGDEVELSEQWRTAVYGAGHPYGRSLSLATTSNLAEQDIAEFRAAHYTPDNATLVIAGRFDAALAERWIDHLFADWTGHVGVRSELRARPHPVALAKPEDLTQLHVRIALPASARDRAQMLVAAAMLENVTSDVRHQLGASYGVDASLVESRLATHYSIAGMIDPAMAANAMQLIRDRLRALRSDPDAAARAFVAARRRVLTQLRAVGGTAARLASRAELDATLGRSPMSDGDTATAVAALTIDAMTNALADLDLDRAAVLMRGPDADIKAAFSVIGRTPTVLATSAATDSAVATGAPDAERRRASDDDDPDDRAEDSIAATDPHTRVAVTVGVGYGIATFTQRNHRLKMSGPTGIAGFGELGYRYLANATVGLHVGIADLSASYTLDEGTTMFPVSVVPVDLAAFIRASGYDRIWGALVVGAHFDRITSIDTNGVVEGERWQTGIGVALEAGVDVVKRGTHRLGATIKAGGVMASDSGYGGLTIGIAYRR
ncbi:MAG: M16 family metallopeptidase [Kofleriaceae bacterium]